MGSFRLSVLIYHFPIRINRRIQSFRQLQLHELRAWARRYGHRQLWHGHGHSQSTSMWCLHLFRLPFAIVSFAVLYTIFGICWDPLCRIFDPIQEWISTALILSASYSCVWILYAFAKDFNSSNWLHRTHAHAPNYCRNVSSMVYGPNSHILSVWNVHAEQAG